MFTPIAIEGQFFNADGSPCSGTICVTPNSTMVNSGEIAEQQSICGLLDSSGRIVSQSLIALIVNANDDSGTTPVGTSYTFTIKIDGQFVEEFSSPVPSGSNSALPAVVTDSVSLTSGSDLITLESLVVSSTMVGKTVTGTGIPGTATITAINATTNQITLNVNASATETSTITITGAAVNIATLQKNAL